MQHLATRRPIAHAALLATLCSASAAKGEPVADGPTTICAPGERPSIGLALSGGGARGGAHVGVLKALQELRVPVDCIAGTSVGAAVGGFYASGLSADEIETITRGIDWQAALSNATPRRNRSFRRKQDDYLFLVNLSPGLRAGGFALPIGFNQGQVIDMTLSRALSGPALEQDFDRLSTPFRAVATDIASGRPVVLDSGDLALALRASMSLPAVLAPIDIDGRMLVDGGLAMNLPVEVAQSMGADVVVAVDATSHLLAREELRSFVDITNQLTTLMTQPAMEREKALLDRNDILLEPSLDPQATFTSFAYFDSTIDAGYRAVMNERARFETLSLDEDQYARHLDERGRSAKLPPVTFVRLDNRSRIADSVIRARMGEIPLDAPLDLDAVERAVGRVYGLQLFQNVHYSLVEDDDGATGVEIRVDERSWGPGYFQAGLHYASSSTVDTIFTMAASYLRTELNQHGGEWRATLALGDEPQVFATLYQPLGPRAAFFVETQAGARSAIFDLVTEGGVSTSFDLRERAAEASAGRVFGGAAELRVGARAVEGNYRLRVGDPSPVPEDDFRRDEIFLRLEADELDSVAFPRAGYMATLEWRSARSDRDFEQVSLRTQAARTWRRQTLLATLRYDATVSGEAPLYGLFRIGGFRDLSGLARNELAGQNAARVGLSWYRRIGNLAMFPAFAGFTFERGNAWNRRSDISYADAIGAASIWAGISTPIGPVYLGSGRTQDGRDSVYLSLGGSF
jgi:NTE family protein